LIKHSGLVFNNYYYHQISVAPYSLNFSCTSAFNLHWVWHDLQLEILRF